MRLENLLEILDLIVTPVAVGYSWLFYFKKIANLEAGRHKRLTLISLVLVSLAILAWPVMAFFMPRPDRLQGVNEANRVLYALWWMKIIVWACVLGLTVNFFGKPRLILPIAVAYVGVIFFWVI